MKGKREKIYPKRTGGKFTKLRWIVNLTILGIYFTLPWIRFNGRQAFLFDIPERKFYIFDLTVWPQDLPYLAVILIFLAVSLFFFTAIAGRLWCGYACPQTLFTDIFMSIEQSIEGDRTERINLDKSPLTSRKFFKKTLKHTIYIILSFVISFTFASYFVSTDVLADRLVTGNLTAANAFWLTLFTVTPYSFCGFLRELICIVPCPYGRFQSTLTDQNTLIIGYDTKRGEPRRESGDCIDCSLCVQVCPTGIDIRDGLQYECIGCAKCIDACNPVMRKLGKPEGLIRYGSLNSFAGEKTEVLRPRVAVYAVILLLIVSGLTYKMVNRVPLDIDILRNRSFLYSKTADGRIINVYTIKVMNMDNIEHRYLIKIEGTTATLAAGDNPVIVKGGEVYQTTLSLILKNGALNKKVNKIIFVIEDTDNPEVSVRKKSTFLLPI